MDTPSDGFDAATGRFQVRSAGELCKFTTTGFADGRTN